MEQIKEEATQLMNSGHITRFVYVDDKFGNTQVGKEEVKLYVQEYVEESGIINHPEVWSEEFEDWWVSSSEEDKLSFIDEHHIEAENAGDLQKKFTQILPITLEQHYLSPEDFTEKQDSILNGIDEMHQLMILVDHRLEGYGRTGEQLLEQISKKDYVHCAIFSGTYTIDREYEKWSSSPHLYTLSKSRISSDDEGAILEGLRSVLWLKQISKLKGYAKESMNKAVSFMNSHLDSIDPATFHKVVMDRSEKEGCWEFETLIRIAYAYMGMGLKNVMQTDGYQEFQALTQTLRNIKRDAASLSPQKAILSEVSGEEIYESGVFINKTYSQISNGDIFQVGNKEYMLLCQPCNLEIRRNGCRSRKDFDQFYLIPIREYNEEKDAKNPLVKKLQKVEGENQQCAVLSLYQRISLSLLDLVAFNEEGKAFLNLNWTPDIHPGKNIIQKNMMLRYASIMKKVIEYKSRYDKIQSTDWSKDEKSKFEKFFCRPYEMGDKEVTKHPLFKADNPNVLDFGIKRVRRYKDPYAKDLLSLFMDYLSRPGYPMELNSRD